MTRALTVFRDTAVEIDENNLREIANARQQLVDASKAPPKDSLSMTLMTN